MDTADNASCAPIATLRPFLERSLWSRTYRAETGPKVTVPAQVGIYSIIKKKSADSKDQMFRKK